MTCTRASLAFGVLALVAITSHAHAQDDAASVPVDPEPPTVSPPPVATEPSTALAPPTSDPIAVLLLPSGGVEPSIADALTELLIAAVAERGGGGRIVGKEEFQAQLGQGDASTAECIESIPCLGRVGVALGVREVIAGTVGRHGDTWAFSLNRIDLRTGAIQGRVFREVQGDLGAVVRALPQSIDDLFVPTVEPGSLVVRSSVDGAEVSLDGVVIGTVVGAQPVRRDLVAPGPHEVVVSAHGHVSYRRTIDVEAATTFALEAELPVLPHHGFDVPWPTWVFGAVAFGSLAVGIGLGVSSSAQPADGTLMRPTQAFYDARQNEAIAADVLFGVALAATTAAVVPLILEATRSPTDTEVALSITPLPGGATLSLAGVFF